MNILTKDTFMNSTLGRSIFFLLLPLLFLQAKPFAYKLSLNKQHAFLHEAIMLNVDINQTDSKPVLLFQFEIQKSPHYRIEQIDAQHDNTPHHTSMHNRYLIYPLKTGEISIHLKLTKRSTNDAKLSYFFSGDRDDFKKLETTDTDIPLSPLTLTVQALPKDKMLVGDFTLSYKIPTHRVNAYTPIPMEITLQGVGYPPEIADILNIESNISIFQQKPLIHKSIKQNDIHYTVTYTFAFTSGKSFDIPSITLYALHPKTKKTYTLSIPTQHFDVNSVSLNTLIDTEDNPKILQSHVSQIKNFFIYLLIFSMGYLSANLIKWRKKLPTTSAHPLQEKISQCNTHKALFQLLIAQDQQAFSSSIKKLEASLYGDVKIPFKQVQKEAMEVLSCIQKL